MYERPVIQVVKQRINEEPRRFIQVIFGPRQVGKTTMALQFSHATPLPYHFASADAIPTDQQAWIAQQWAAARIKTQQAPAKVGVLIIDEIQKINNWSELVKKVHLGCHH